MAQKQFNFTSPTQVTNTATGQTLTLGAGTHFLSEQWTVASTSNPTQTPTPTTQPTNSPAPNNTPAPVQNTPVTNPTNTQTSSSPTPTPQPTGIIKQVEDTPGELVANKEYVNAVFKAYHGRDANQDELNNFTGKRVSYVRDTIKAGAPAQPAAGTIISPYTGETLTSTPPGTGAIPDYVAPDGTGYWKQRKPAEQQPQEQPQQTDLQSQVTNTPGGLRANENYVNAVFQAFLGRDATQAELDKYTGLTVDDVRVKVAAGTDFESTFAGSGTNTGSTDIVDAADITGGSKEFIIPPLDSFAPSSTTDPNTFIKAFQSIFDQFLQPFQQEESRLEKQLQSQLDKLGTKGERTLKLEQQTQLYEKQQQLSEINGRINLKVAEYNEINERLEQEPIALPVIRGRQTELQRLKAAEIAVLAAQGSMIQGQIDLANDYIQRALDLEFGDLETQINATSTFLQLNSDKMNRAEQRAASALNVILAAQQQVLEEKRTRREQNYNLMLEVAKVGGDPRLVDINADPAFNLQRVGSIFTADIDTQVIKLDDGSQVLINSKTGEVIKQFDSGVVNNFDTPGTIENSIYNALKFAGTGFTEAERKDNTTTIANLLSNGQLTEAKEFLKRVVLTEAPTEQQNKAFGRGEAIAALENIQSLLDQYQQKGGDTGFFTGKIEDIANKIGKTTDPELAQIQNQIRLALVDYRRAVSGAAFTEAEAREYERLFPSIGKVENFNTATIDSLLSTFKRNDEVFMRAMIGSSNYDAIFSEADAVSGLQLTGNDLSDLSILLGTPGIGEQIPGLIDQGVEYETIVEYFRNKSSFDGSSGNNSPTSSINLNDGSVNIPSSSRLAYVNNNPGNLRYIGQQGASEGEGGFARFDSPEAGFNALINDIKAKQSGNSRTGLNGSSTLKDFVYTYAPPSENNSAQYVNNLASLLGVSADTPIGQIDTQDLAIIIAQLESSTVIV